ncbi:4-hydroxythreonine-4-phosphate dehydrogenase PdxA [Xylophilus sp. GOD-11R]|uniref:4-hydroxythreonine-4-phosphate dehydrogenase PdxA n=1 Tax=Xylophilus sp. GOD-11R TaxID=3089814 RepID=UPI00298CB6DF|nr:4-hydroxythreonine-4-phosphate dehydrogenase PdxA [Xylophilus sp. GOD-11R]WPB57614.1 4-hydroxythreonine-4-phosphate dehydrogenase PdxA [Xylophilus sp. GOD-11R]
MSTTDTMTTPSALPIAVTAGDPAGIGPEIVARLFRDHADEMRGCFAVGDVAVLRRAAECLGTPSLPVAVLASAGQAWAAAPHCLPVLPVVEARAPVDWGVISAEAGRQAAEAVVWASRAALRGAVAAVVTAPLHKEALSAAGVDFPGHTELLQAEAAAHAGTTIDRMPVRMMLANQELRTVLVSIHMSLRDALDAVTFDNVLATLRISATSLSRLLGRPARLAVAGVNPHAGEGGLFGREEIDIVAPAIAAARAEGIDAHGPFPPDTIFMRARASAGRADGFDAVVAMYHDQGLIPVKYLGIEDGVNVTLGLPLVRTSPDHGTAFDLAGTGRADASSLLAAVRMARRLAG